MNFLERATALSPVIVGNSAFTFINKLPCPPAKVDKILSFSV
jgi:hypothetical protein